MSKEDKWINWWTEKADEDFLRRPGIENHPVRVRMGEEAALIGGMVLDGGCCSSICYPRLKSLGLIDEDGNGYVGIDRTPKFLAYGRKLNPGIRLINASVMNMPIREKCFATVYLKDVVQHLHPDEYPEALKESWRAANWLLLVATNRRFLDKARVIVQLHTRDHKPFNAFANFYSWQRFTKNLRSLEGSHFRRILGLDAPEDENLPSVISSQINPKATRQYSLFIIHRIDRPIYRWQRFQDPCNKKDP